ncbi:MAG: hypothetical protein QOE96_3627 [Blastocatellia bacterium]|nr:hypothetical protein [Blastocatellia bacterium]
MNTRIKISLLLCASILFTACPKYRPSVNFNRNGFVKQVNDHFTAEQTAYFTALGAKDTATAKIVRNEAIEEALPYIDEAYMDFITALQAGRDRDNFVADVIELGATAAVGITNGQRPLHIIGVALTAFRGGRRSADLNFYKEQATPVLISKMDGNRATVRATILNREKEEVTTYSIHAAIGDIVDYYNAGTLVRAFTELQKDTASQTRDAEQNVIKLKGVPITGPPSAEEHARAVEAQNQLAVLYNDLNGKDATKKAVAEKRLQLIVAALQSNTEAVAALKEESATPQSDGASLYTALVDIRLAARVVNNTAILKTINQAIIDEMAKPAPPVSTASPSPTPSPSPTVTPSPAASPTR